MKAPEVFAAAPGAVDVATALQPVTPVPEAETCGLPVTVVTVAVTVAAPFAGVTGLVQFAVWSVGVTLLIVSCGELALVTVLPFASFSVTT